MVELANKVSILILGILTGLVIWVGSAAYDCFVLQIGDFLSCLISAPEPRLSIRVSAVLTGLAVGIGGQVFANKILANQRMKALFEHSNDGQILIDPDTGKILEVNGRVVDFLGYDRSEILRMSLADFHPHEIGTATEFLNRVLCDGTGLEDSLSCRRKDGTFMPAEVSAKAFEDAGRRYVVVSLRNISKRVRAQQEREAALHEAQIASRAKSDFLAVMSHELRTPLNAILGFSEMISRQQLGVIEIPAYREYADHIHKAGKHLFGIISDILMLTRIERGREPFEPEWVCLKDICASVAQMLTNFADDHGILLTTECAAGAPLAWVDERKVKQILTNLISNSVKATARGGRITIRYEYGKSAGHMIAVDDTGSGMSDEQIASSFEPFTAANGASPLKRGVSESGIGLGLPLSRQLADMHGGRIAIKRRQPCGTQVAVFLPGQVTSTKSELMKAS